MAGSAIEEVKARIDLAEVIEATVPLKKAGRTYKGLCPFHGEKTPSFTVYPETGTWKCYGCGEGGDAFSFVQKRDNLDFPEALRLLAHKAGVELPARDARPPEAKAAEERRYEALAAAELYYRAALGGAAGAAARAYLERRGVNAESVERFGLGYAPSGGLLRHLEGHGFSADEAAEVGVAGRRDDGSRYEMFRERLIFPIRDAAGKTIGFGGRTLGDSQPKYLNGPQTPFFDKSGCLFALDLARAAIRQSGQAIIVEGYLDALIAHQYGFQDVVATLGTALTERHLELLGRRAREIILALDADAAGQAATRRGLEVAQNAPADAVVAVPTPGLRGLVRFQAVRRSQIKVLTLPAGLDPDELIRQDATAWPGLVAAATPVVDFVLSRLGERHDLATADGKREAVQEAMGVLRDLTDPVEREHYLQRLAAAVGLDESGLREAFGRLRPRALESKPAEQPTETRALPEAYALALYLLDRGGALALASEACTSPEAGALVTLLGGLPPDQRDASGLAALAEQTDPSLHPALAEVAAWLPRLADLPADQRARELEVAVLKLRQQRLRVQHREVLTLLAEPAEATGAAGPAAMLSAIAAQLREIEAALAARDGVGSLVWRSRQVGEVFGG